MGRKSVHAHVAEDVTPAEAWNRLRERCLRSRVAVDEGGELELVLYRLAKWLDRLERSTSLTVVQVEVLAEVIETAVEAGRAGAGTMPDARLEPGGRAAEDLAHPGARVPPPRDDRDLAPGREPQAALPVADEMPEGEG
jgi:hypothetical protein